LQRTLGCPFFRKAFGWSVPIGALGGLIGLGGGELADPLSDQYHAPHAEGLTVMSFVTPPRN
jgi:hypothetical protein